MGGEGGRQKVTLRKEKDFFLSIQGVSRIFFCRRKCHLEDSLSGTPGRFISQKIEKKGEEEEEEEETNIKGGRRKGLQSFFPPFKVPSSLAWKFLMMLRGVMRTWSSLSCCLVVPMVAVWYYSRTSPS